MKLENQVVSLDLAKRLKELGVKQESLFYWVSGDIVALPEWRVAQKREIRLGKGQRTRDVETYSAFTVAELGEMLPGNTGTKSEALYFVTQKGLMGRMWYCNAIDMLTNKPRYGYEGNTEADARAKILIYLLKNKLIETAS